MQESPVRLEALQHWKQAKEVHQLVQNDPEIALRRMDFVGRFGKTLLGATARVWYAAGTDERLFTVHGKESNAAGLPEGVVGIARIVMNQTLHFCDYPNKKYFGSVVDYYLSHHGDPILGRFIHTYIARALFTEAHALNSASSKLEMTRHVMALHIPGIAGMHGGQAFAADERLSAIIQADKPPGRICTQGYDRYGVTWNGLPAYLLAQSSVTLPDFEK